VPAQQALLPAVLRATLPVFFGYVPLGLAFGVLFSQLGAPWPYATLMGFAVYAGSAQFLAVALLGAGAGLVEIALATLLLNARHVFYGLSMASRFSRVPGPGRWYLVFGLTDETYSLLTATKPPAGIPQARFDLAVTALNQFWWVLGCTLGGLLGSGLTLDLAGLEFTLTALFVVLLMEQARQPDAWISLLCAAAGAVFAVIAFGADDLLLAGLASVTLLLMGEYGGRRWATVS
jgi:4-azaleucine resistance transporter AzlC